MRHSMEWERHGRKESWDSAENCWISSRRTEGLGGGTGVWASAACAAQSAVDESRLGDDTGGTRGTFRTSVDLFSM